MSTVSGGSKGIANVPIPKSASKFGRAEEYEANPFGFAQDDEDHYW
jgi:hypothetical protein